MSQLAHTKAAIWSTTLLAGCLAAVGLAGCCGTQAPACSEAADHPFPAGPEYPRFHPVPTRPVFLPEGVETAQPQPELHAIEAPPLAAVPDDGWRPPSKAAH